MIQLLWFPQTQLGWSVVHIVGIGLVSSVEPVVGSSVVGVGIPELQVLGSTGDEGEETEEAGEGSHPWSDLDWNDESQTLRHSFYMQQDDGVRGIKHGNRK